MYERYYGLRQRPFELTPNPAFLYLSQTHREALANVEYGIAGAKGITLLVGEAGTGKTTVVRAAIQRLSGRGLACVSLNNPKLTRSEFYEFLATGFRLSPHAAASKARFLLELMTLVGTRQRAGQLTALVIDEAQAVPGELLEEVRLLANLETATAKLLPVVLVGQPELSGRLEDPALRQLKQRVALRCELSALNLKETIDYVATRVRQAGGDVTTIFTPDAMFAIFCASAGIPRTISVLCDNVLITGFAADVRPIGPDVVAEVCRDFRLSYTVPMAVPQSWQSAIQIERRRPQRATAPVAVPGTDNASEDGVEPACEQPAVAPASLDEAEGTVSWPLGTPYAGEGAADLARERRPWHWLDEYVQVKVRRWFLPLWRFARR